MSDTCKFFEDFMKFHKLNSLIALNPIVENLDTKDKKPEKI